MGRLAGEVREASLFLNTENPLFFDVGANDGDYTQEVLSKYPGAKVFAFEPDGEREIFKTNDSHVILSNLALSNDEVPRKLHKPGGLHSQNAFHLRPHFRDYSVSIVDCECTTLDSFIIANGLTSIDFIKIDTEGHEVDVLLGARDSLKKRVIKAGSFEYGGTWFETGRKFWEALTLLKSFDYQVFTVEGDKKIEMTEAFVDNWEYFNFYFSHANSGG